MKFLLALLLLSALNLEMQASTPKTLSKSKLGPHILINVKDPGVQTLLNANPRVAKWVLPMAGTMQSLKAYKHKNPQGTTVLRVWWPVKVKYDLSWKPADAAKDYWQNMVKGGLPLPAPKEVDWLEGLNEFDNLPTDRWYDEPKASRWFAQFWSALADTMNAAGYHPMVGSFVAGQPKVEALKPLAKVMKSKKYAWSWGYHSYTLGMTKDLKQEMEYTFHYRTLSKACDLQGIPLILSEGGFLDPPASKGWKASHTAAEYLNWLKWFDSEIKKDKDVVGLTIFQSGNKKDFASFDLEPLAKDLAAYLKE